MLKLCCCCRWQWSASLIREGVGWQVGVYAQDEGVQYPFYQSSGAHNTFAFSRTLANVQNFFVYLPFPCCIFYSRVSFKKPAGLLKKDLIVLDEKEKLSLDIENAFSMFRELCGLSDRKNEDGSFRSFFVNYCHSHPFSPGPHC